MKAKKVSWSRYLRNGLGRRLAMLGERTGQDWLIYNPLVIRQFHDQGLYNAPLVASVILDSFPQAEAVLDVGCGTGALAAEFMRRGRRAVGLERSPYGRKLALRQRVDCRDFDLTRTAPANVPEKFDLVYCFEVAEHIPEALGEKLVMYLCDFDSPVIFSAAQPGQGGTGHINEQSAAYWIQRFRRRSFRFERSATDKMRSGFRVNNAALWFQRNVIVMTPSHASLR
jgi:SAM-dependent methyltransferase